MLEKSLLDELPFAILTSFIVLCPLYISNLTFDRGTENYLSRKISHFGGGVAFLLAPFLFSRPWWPLILCFGFALLLGGARLLRPATFRGTGGSGRSHAHAEVFFPIAGGLGVLNWVFLGNPFLGCLPGVYLGFGDMVTGLTRNWHCKRERKGWCGTIAMITICLLLSYFIRPYWIGIAGAITVTLVEKFTTSSRYYDDNLSIPLTGALVMGILYATIT